MSRYYDKKKVHSFEKSKFEELQFAVKDYKGKPYADIQVYHVHEDGSKEATGKGLFIAVSKLHDFKQGIERLIEETGSEKAE